MPKIGDKIILKTVPYYEDCTHWFPMTGIVVENKNQTRLLSQYKDAIVFVKTEKWDTPVWVRPQDIAVEPNDILKELLKNE